MKSMNIIEYSEGLQARMKQELDKLDTNQDEIIKIGKALAFIRELISELKAFTRNYKFQNQAEEIQFFKEVKPIFLSQYFYYKKVFAIRLFDSFKDVKSRRTNYYRILHMFEVNVKKNQEFYEYIMSGDSYLDSNYFIRTYKDNKSLDRDEKFSTGYDIKLSRVLANELLKKYILKLLNQVNVTRPTLTWTGSKTDLIELIYALHCVDVFNNGSANIKSIASGFEDLFNINLGDYYRTFQDMRLRKKSRAPFLDFLKDKFSHRVNDLNDTVHLSV